MFKFVKSNDPIVTDSISVLIYGEPGIGKTSVSFTAEKPLLLDFDNGLQRAVNRKDAVKIDSWEDLKNLIESKDFKDFKPRTLIIDTVGSMLDNYLANYVKKVDPKNSRTGGELSLQGYGAIKNSFNDFKNTMKALKVNLIFIAHSTSEGGEDGKKIPKISGGSYDILRQESDLIGYMYSNRNQRVIDFSPKDSHIGKNCTEFPLLIVPHYNESDYSSFFKTIVDKTIDRMNKMEENNLDVLQKLETFKNYIADFSEPMEFTSVLNNEIKDERDRTIQTQFFDILKKRAKEFGILYSPKDKEFFQKERENKK